MRDRLLVLLVVAFSAVSFAQEPNKAKGIIINTSNQLPLEGANVVNLNQVVGTATDSLGRFEINAKANDTLHLSYIGFKSIKVKVTNDWLKYGQATISLTELALALETVTINQLRLTGYLEVDIKQVPVVNNNFRYSISGLPSTGYEAGNTGTVSKVLSSIFNPADFLHRTFGKRGVEMQKLRKMKTDDEIRNMLATRFDREMLLVLLNVDKVDLDEIINQCNYSKGFIQTANDLQILDAINACYEEYKVLNKKY